MKKFFVSSFIVLTFVAYVIYEQLFGNPSTLVLQQSKALLSQSAPQTPSSAAPTTSTASQKPVQSQSAVVSQPAPAPVTTQPKGLYANGTYTGKSIDVYYGNVQVAAVISGGKLTDVKFLDYPQDRTTSLMKSNYALPILKSEAIQAQSAQVSGVSGATETTSGFIQSLSSALAMAKN